MDGNKLLKDFSDVKSILEKIYQLLLAKNVKSREVQLVLTTQDLKDIFQVSDSTINRLIKLSSFPECWYGIRGHYPRDQVIKWFEKHDYTDYQEKMEAIRRL